MRLPKHEYQKYLEITESKAVATKGLKVGDKVSWSSTQGKVFGLVKKKLIAPMDIKTHHVAASPDNPQLLVLSKSTGKVAAHKPAALAKLKVR